jgi:chromosome segregation ATPase
VAATLESHLQAAGLLRCSEQPEALPSDALVLYAPPDVLLAAGLESLLDPPSPQQLAQEYKRVQSFGGRHTLIAAWRLEALTPEAISQWLLDASPLHVDRPFPNPEPLTALLTKTLLETQPDLLETYLDLELIAELAGGEPDTGYRQRMTQAAGNPQQLLERWWLPHKQLHSIQQEKAGQVARADALEAVIQQGRQETERHVLELQQLRGRLKRLVGVDQEKTAQIEQLQAAVETESDKVLVLEADLAQYASERDGARREREAIERERDVMEQQRDAMAGEKAAVTAAMADLNHQLCQHQQDLGLARDREAQLLARAEALEGENQRACEEAERLLTQLHDVQEDLERLFLADHTNAARIEQLQGMLDSQIGSTTLLEAELERIRSDRDGATRERDAVAEEKAAVMAAMADLNHQLSQHQQDLGLARETEVQLLARAEALEGENQRSREEAERLLTQLHDVQEELERLFLADHTNAARIEHLQGMLDSQIGSTTVLQAELVRIRSERDGATQDREAIVRDRDAVVRQRDAVEEEKAAAMAKVADLNHQLYQHQQELGLARETEVRLRGELEGLVGVDQEKTAQIGQLQAAVERESAKVLVLEADLAQFRSERDSATQEREALARERDAVVRQRDAVAEEKADVMAKVADLNHQLFQHQQDLGLAREEAERQLAQLHHVQEELERLFLADHTNLLQIQQLRDTLHSQTSRTAALEADLEQIRSERDGALRERDGLAQEKTVAFATVADLNARLSGQSEALRQARAAEAQLNARTDALESEKGLAREEARSLLVQLHHLQEELEKSFLHGQAGDQLISAQHEQLMRAQSLMSRLLVQATRSLLPAQVISVEVLPPQTANSHPRSLPSGSADRPGWGSGLLRKVWTR